MTNEVVITINGEQVGFRFGILAIDKMARLMNVEFADIVDANACKKLSAENGFMLFHYMLIGANYCYNEEKSEPSRAMVDSWLMSMSDSDLKKVLHAFQESMKIIASRIGTIGKNLKKK